MSGRNERRREIRDRQKRRHLGRVKALAERAECILCLGHACYVGIWEPSPEVLRQLLVASGRVRIYAYSLCQRCKVLPDAPTLIEDAILARHERGAIGVSTN